MQQTGRRRAATLATAILYSVVVVAILGTLNFLANRYNKSYDSTTNKAYTLSDQTEKIAKNLQQDLTITYWGQPNNFQQARDLLDRYQNLSHKVDVKYEDTDKKRTQAIAAGVKSVPTIFVQIGNKKEEAKSLTEDEVTGAIVRVLKGGDRTVCFTLGSGEHATDDTGRDGYSTANDQVVKSNYKTKEIKLLPNPEIPLDCTIVVVAGPKHDYLAPEVASLKQYVENGGRVLFLLDAPLKFAGAEVDDNSALMAVLSDWGVTPQKDLVLDLSGVGQLYQAGPELPIVTAYDTHAIVRGMKDVWTAFPLARSLEVKSTNDKATVEKLFETSDDSIATTNLAPAGGEVRPSKNDQKGPFTLGAAGVYKTGKETGNGRFVVVGSSGFPANYVIGFQGNRDLFLNMLSWLSSDEDLISIRPKEPNNNPLNMNQRQVSLMFYESVFGLPLLVVAFGAGVWWKRR